MKTVFMKKDSQGLKLSSGRVRQSKIKFRNYFFQTTKFNFVNTSFYKSQSFGQQSQNTTSTPNADSIEYEKLHLGGTSTCFLFFLSFVLSTFIIFLQSQLLIFNEIKELNVKLYTIFNEKSLFTYRTCVETCSGITGISGLECVWHNQCNQRSKFRYGISSERATKHWNEFCTHIFVMCHSHSTAM